MSDTLQQINQALQHKIDAEIKRSGTISFARFMHLALYEPGLGYYSSGLNKLGKDGDFVTSSELGHLFAQTLARVFAPMLKTLDQGWVLELGAGSGAFCADVLMALNELGQLPHRYLILEVSADLKQVQQQRISQLPPAIRDRVHWLDEPPEQAFNGLVFANEVIDALPVEVFRSQTHGYERLMLACDDVGIRECWKSFPADLNHQLENRQLTLEPGYRSEFIPHLDDWLHTVTHALRTGWVFFIDYGYGRPLYYHPQRNSGTLVCQRRHQAHFDPYRDVGLQDITAFVDFTAVAEGLQQAGFELIGYCTQGDFLVDAGIHERLDPTAPYADYYRLASELKQLVLPDEMGEKFKVMVAGKGVDQPIRGLKHNRWRELG
jgi:SAM-dependent MidA family methyltransferase